MKLVNQAGELIRISDVLVFPGDGVSPEEHWVVDGWREPHKPSSTGRVYVHPSSGTVHEQREFFPGVFNLKFVEEA